MSHYFGLTVMDNAQHRTCNRTGITLKIRPTVRLMPTTKDAAFCPATGKLNPQVPPKKFSMDASRWQNRQNCRWGITNVPVGIGCGKTLTKT